MQHVQRVWHIYLHVDVWVELPDINPLQWVRSNLWQTYSEGVAIHGSFKGSIIRKIHWKSRDPNIEFNLNHTLGTLCTLAPYGLYKWTVVAAVFGPITGPPCCISYQNSLPKGIHIIMLVRSHSFQYQDPDWALSSWAHGYGCPEVLKRCQTEADCSCSIVYSLG